MADEIKAIVIDNGTSKMKVGWAGDGDPTAVFPSFIGRSRLDVFPTYCSCIKDLYIGDEALSEACILSLKYPIEHGIVVNWDDMEKIYNHIFENELHANPTEHHILLTEALLNPKANREKMIQIMFETFNVPSFYVGYQGILSLYSSGRNTGIVCGVGESVSSIIPIYEGYPPIHNAISRKNFGGQDIINHLQHIINYRGYTFTTSEEKEILRNIFEEHSLVSLDYDTDLRKSQISSEFDASSALPDGNCITLSDERFRCTEILFKPEIIGYEFEGIDKMIINSIEKCTDIKKDLYENIVLSGGVTLIENFPERVEKEITNHVSSIYKISIVAPSYRLYCDWIGGSIFASLATFPQMVVTHDEYNEDGPGIVHRKCHYYKL